MKRAILAFGRRPVTCVMIAAAACVLGAASIPRLPPGLLPSLANPGITITIRYPGVEGRKLEEIITIPVERQIGQISGIEELISVSSSGESRTHAVFSHDSDVKIKLLEASEKLQQIRGTFPREVQEPVIVQYDSADRPVFIVSFSSKKYDLRTLRTIVDRQIKPSFERIEGVSEAAASGGFEREIHVTLDSARLTKDLTPQAVGRFLSRSNAFSSGGRISVKNGVEQSITMDSRYLSAAEIQASLLPAPASLPLESIARVLDTFREPDSISRTNGEERVTIYLQKGGSSNALSISRAARDVLASRALPEVTAEIQYDQGEFIERAVYSAIGSCISGGLAAVFVLYVFLRRPRLTLLIALTLPVCLSAVLFAMYLGNIEVNTVTLSGLALASGMLIDNSIVVTEAMARDEGGGLQGAQAVSGEILAATLSTIIVFIPLVFADPGTRQLYEGLALTVTAALLSSIVFSLFLLPALACSAGAEPEPLPVLERIVSPLKPQRLNSRIWKGVLLLLRYPLKTAAVCAAICASLPLLFTLSPRESLVPSDERTIEGSVDLPTGTHLAETARAVSAVERQIRAHPAVRDVSSRIDQAHASLHVRVRPDYTDGPDSLIAELTSGQQDPDVFVHFTRAADESSDELEVEFYGDDQEQLKQTARSAARSLPEAVSGIRRVLLRFREEKTDLLLRLDPLRMAVESSASAGGTLRSLVSGAVVTRIFDGEREIDVRVTGTAVKTPEDAAALLMPGGQAVSTFSSLETETNDAKLWRKNKRRMVAVSLEVEGRSLEDVAADVRSALASLPHGVDFAFGSDFQKQAQSQREMLLCIGFSVLLIYLLLGFLFESFLLPLLVIAPVPLSWAGILLYSALFQYPLNLSVYIGMILLGGLVVNHSIIVLSSISETVARRKAHGRGLLRTVLRASTARIRPIAMTALTTIAGVLPMILSTGAGNELWKPLSVTVACGLGIALVTSLLIVPALANLFYSRKEGP